MEPFGGNPTAARHRIDPPATISHAEAIAENLRRIAAALPPLPLHIASRPLASSPEGEREVSANSGRQSDQGNARS